ncbi:odorant receptor 85c-like [Sitodiplosis mosellana]|uniref:odorant receptor 85c-like n=1 Tax=Sitodiplosis mosellana TaxID=263140 RepID=UPI002445101B|nr:odorant receptor 85c-like [Sitodiplosis mosellana]
MVPLATSRLMLTWHCVCPAGDSTNEWLKLAHVPFISLILIAQWSAVASSFAFFMKFISTDLETALYAVFQMAAFSPAVYSIFVTLLLRRDINDLLDQLSQFYRDASDESFRFLAQANNRSEKIWKWFFMFIVSTNIGIILMWIASLIICRISHGYFDTKFLLHPFKVSLPWNQKTLIGYIFEFLSEFVFSCSYYYSNGTVVILFVSICLHHQAHFKIFQKSLTKLNGPGENRNDATLLRALIQFHGSAMNWFMASAQVHSGYILVQLLCSMLMMACVIFQMDLALKHLDFGFCFMFIVVIISASNLSLWCYFGTLATESFEKMALCLYESNWLDLPIHLQKYYVIMIANAQRPLLYHGFGFITLNMNTFARLLKTVITYYMMFKSITAE